MKYFPSVAVWVLIDLRTRRAGPTLARVMLQGPLEYHVGMF